MTISITPPLDTSRVVRILSFDPGGTEMGVCVADFDLDAKTFTVLYTNSVKGTSLLKEYKYLRPHFAQSFCVQTAYYTMVKEDCIEEWEPDYVISESAFYGKIVNAIVSLTLVINSIRMAARDTMGRDINLVTPVETKMSIAKQKDAKKDEIRMGVLRHPAISFIPTILNYDFLTEHEYDAIGHGYAFCEKHLPLILAGLPVRTPKKKKRKK